MTRLCLEHGGVNLAQGFPDFPAPAAVKEAARRAIAEDVNQYAITWGAAEFRRALAEKHLAFSGVHVDPEREITVTCGSTEAMLSALLATVDPGEEVIVFEPWYENYGPDTILSGAVPVFVKLHPPDFTYDPDELRRAFSPRTKGIIVNTPHNPTGKVFTRKELEHIALLANEFDTLVYTDEIYEHIVYDGRTHVYPHALPELRQRTVMISGLSKTYSVTGWRIGYAIAPAEITAAIRKVHDFCTVGAPAPLQRGAVAALTLGPEYYRDLREGYQKRRDAFLPLLSAAGFRPYAPQGAYYVMAEFPERDAMDDVAFARFLVESVGVAVVPASSFYRRDSSDAAKLVRFCFSKQDATLAEAGRRLMRLVSDRA
ncbi:MAG TPA: aminotransferase class I/II-fold pyridoxal phosphate-dependent enzyme [Polyangiaceae bacterium]|nr:aminotransferase class I/II-fold pyridoxal phosphate-dependent enzyme [Polyangiaceae bacterium]